MITLKLNGQDHPLDATEDMPLLWAIRDVAGYNGEELLIVSTKFSCDLKEGRVTDMVLKPVDAYTQAPLKSRQKKGWAGGKAPKGGKSK